MPDIITGSNIVPNYAIGVTQSPLFNDPLQDVPIDSIVYKTSEVGQSGTLNYSGFLDTEEWIGELKNYTLYKTIDYMRTDAIISAIEKGFFLPIEKSNVSFGYDYPEIIKDPQAQQILDFIKEDFSGINIPDFLHNANLFIPYGFSIFEQIYKQDQQGFLHLERLAPRLPKTAWRWVIDGHGYLRVLVQLVYTPQPDGSNGYWKYIAIPAEKLVIITGQKEGGNFAGRSEYRPFYREWLVKDATLKQIIITIKRVGGGIPTGLVNKDAPETASANIGGDVDTNQSAAVQWETAFKQMAAGENAYIVGKWLDKIDLLSINPSALAELLNTCRYMDESIAKSAFQMFMNLGSSGNSGNRALGQTFEGLYYQGENGKAARIMQAVNEQIIKRLVDMNFGKQKHYPKMFMEIEQNLDEILKTLGELKRYGLITGNTDIENHVMDKWALPRTTAENALKTEAPLKSESGGTPVNPKTAYDEPADNTMSELNLSDYKRKRPANKKEKYLDLDNMESGLNGMKKSMSDELRKIVEPEMINLVNQLAIGVRPYLIQAPQYGNKIADTFRKYYKQIADKAKEHVKREIVKQNIKLSDRIMLADNKIKTNKQLNYEKWYNEEANIQSELLTNNWKSATYKYYSTAKSQGLDGEALKDFIVDEILSEAGQRYDSAASSVLSSYGMVREIGVDEFKDVVSSKIRTGIFDGNICDHCAEEDGQEYFYDPEQDDYFDVSGLPAPILPDFQCEGEKGGNKCRCIWLYNTGPINE